MTLRGSIAIIEFGLHELNMNGGGEDVWLVLWLALRMGVVGPAVRETPLDILKARYARGEISKAQYQELKQDLSEPQC